MLNFSGAGASSPSRLSGAASDASDEDEDGCTAARVRPFTGSWQKRVSSYVIQDLPGPSFFQKWKINLQEKWYSHVQKFLPAW